MDATCSHRFADDDCATDDVVNDAANDVNCGATIVGAGGGGAAAVGSALTDVNCTTFHCVVHNFDSINFGYFGFVRKSDFL